METVIGFVAGYIAGCQDGPDGVKRLRSTAEAIISSEEFRRLAAEAMSFAETFARRAASRGGQGGLAGTVGTVSDLVHRASALGKGPRAA
ncbi:MAG TPA: hypothetical protein VMR00_02565 [Streptosporangiaceae bacterium]|jgi:hypothetical protein|nr:hypothetical protein [Streptosporangiaceae bacterium]